MWSIARGAHVAIALVNEKLVHRIKVSSRIVVVKESDVKYKRHRLLMTLADDIANYFRMLLRN